MLTIAEIQKIITPICVKYGVKELYLFGSYARQEATNTSDIDIRINAGNVKDLFTLSAFRIDLVAALGLEVDIVSTLPISSKFQKSLKTDEVLLYAA